MSHAELISLYTRIDDSMWAAMSSPGLLRRAHKDLTSVTITAVDSPATDEITIMVGEHRVALRASGPQHSVCDCAATGLCRHLITAGLWLTTRQDDTTTQAATPIGSAIDALLAFDRAALLRHCGRDEYRWAQANTVDLGADELVTDADGSVRITLPIPSGGLDSAVVLHYPGGDLAMMLPDGIVTDLPRLQVCAVLSTQRSRGVTVGDPGPLAPTPTERRNAEARRRMYAAVRMLLSDTVVVGTAHVSEATVQRYDAAAITAQIHDHFRLAAALRRLASYARAILARTAGAGEDHLTAELATTLALLTALDTADQPTPRLLGVARSGYHEVGPIELYGLGAHPWRSASGYVGITALFWCVTRSQFLTYTDARPETVGGFDPVAEYTHGEPGWPGVRTIAAATGARVALSQVRMSAQGRLSGTGASAARITPVEHHDLLAALPVTDHWHTLSEDAASSTGPALLDPPPPQRDWVALRPSIFGSPTFDDVSQAVQVPIIDDAGTELLLRMTYQEFSAHAVGRLLAEVPVANGTVIVGRVERFSGTTTLNPLSFIRPDRTRQNPVDALYFDPPPAGAASTHPAKQTRAPSAAASPGNLVGDTDLNRFDGWLIRTIERGVAGREGTVRQELSDHCRRLHRAGFTVFPDAPAPAPAVRVAELLLRSAAIVRQLRRVPSNESGPPNTR